MTTISQEEENYVRMSLLLSGISPRAVRVLFDIEFDPTCLDSTFKKLYIKLKDLKQKRVINQVQWDLLFPRNGGSDSKRFDVTLMITLLTNLTTLNHYDKLPVETDTTPSADLSRIKYYRNHISHNTEGKIDDSFFSTAWISIVEAVGRLGGQNFNDECIELKTKILDQETVPWNIRVQISQILEEWKINSYEFVETRAAKHVLKCVQENSCITITASSGVGKTATLQNVALKMAEDGYNILLVTNPDDIIKFHNPNKKTLFVIDDFCGTYSINKLYLNCLELVMERIKVLIQNKRTKILVACRLQVFNDTKFKSLSNFTKCVCHLSSDDLCLSHAEKQSIAESYLKTEYSEIMHYCDLYDCFPLLCKLYSNNPELNAIDFFKNPFSVYEKELDKLHEQGHLKKYCALALIVMFNNRLKEEWLTEEVGTNTKLVIENTCESCRLDKCTSRLTLLDELNALEYTFVKKDKGTYKTIHDKVFDFLASYFGRKMVQCLIRNASSLVIMQRFLLHKTDDMDQFIIVVPTRYHQLYIERVIDDWYRRNRVQYVFNNINMKIQEFRKTFLMYLSKFDVFFQRHLSKICDVSYKDTVLIQCCYLGDTNFIQWCIYNGVDVNKCKHDGVSPLHASAQEGHLEIVKILLDRKADINRRTDIGETPLSIACQTNHIEVVKLLLDNKADVNKCMNDGTSPLCISCSDNHDNKIEIVKLLLGNKADINKCRDDETSPLIMTCQNNHIETLQLLLDNKADINKCMNNGVSPLFIACQNNNKEMVHILLDNKADINKCRDNGASPLTIACQINSIEIVKILLDNKADINKCTDDGGSPIVMACQNNHIQIVQLLLDNKAVINTYTDSKTTPLYIACEHNHIDIVKLLLEKKPDINKCSNYQASPLYIACQNNYKEIVKALLGMEADIEKCRDSGESPLFIACQSNHIEILKMLLDKKADMNKCTDNGIFPLLTACMNNHIDIVKILLENKADINKCTDEGIYPLLVACVNGRIDLIKVLLDNNADINKCANDGSFPLFVACHSNHIDIVKLLLDNNADMNKCMNDGASPLFAACTLNHIDILKVLLHNKADIDKCTDDGESPLFISCHNNHLEIVKELLDNKANINKCRDDGVSPLFAACYNNHIDVVKVLLQNKADINKCTDDAKSLLLIACQNNDIEIVRMMLENGANYNQVKKAGCLL